MVLPVEFARVMVCVGAESSRPVRFLLSVFDGDDPLGPDSRRGPQSAASPHRRSRSRDRSSRVLVTAHP